MESLRDIPGFLGTGASLFVDISLIIEVLFYIVLCLGVTAQLGRQHRWHNRLQTSVVGLNLIFISLVMIPTLFTILSGGVSQLPGVVLIHTGLGILAELAGIYCLLAGFKILPRKIGILRYFMWTTFVLWTMAVLFGVALYISFYTSDSAESEAVSQQTVELISIQPTTEVKVVATPLPTRVVRESTKESTAEVITEQTKETVAEQPTNEPTEHAIEPVETVEEQTIEPTKVVVKPTVTPTSEPTPTLTPAPIRVGFITISDNEAHGDKITLTLTQVTPPPDGSVYEAWLTSEGRKPFSMGKLTITGGAINHTFTDPQGRNLLGLYNGAFISVEPNKDNVPYPSDTVIYKGEVSPLVMEQVRLMVASPNMPGGKGFALKAKSQLLKIKDEIGFQQNYSIPNNDLVALKIQAEGIINIIEGKTGSNYGDINGDGQIYNQGDGFGLLGSGEGAGYLQAIVSRTITISQIQDASAETILRAKQTQTAAQNTIDRLEQIRNLELQVLKASNVAAAMASVKKVAELSNLLNDAGGSDLTNPNQTGIQAIYNYTQLIGAIEIFTLPGQPTTAPTPAPTDEHADGFNNN